MNTRRFPHSILLSLLCVTSAALGCDSDEPGRSAGVGSGAAGELCPELPAPDPEVEPEPEPEPKTPQAPGDLERPQVPSQGACLVDAVAVAHCSENTPFHRGCDQPFVAACAAVGTFVALPDASAIAGADRRCELGSELVLPCNEAFVDACRDAGGVQLSHDGEGLCLTDLAQSAAAAGLGDDAQSFAAAIARIESTTLLTAGSDGATLVAYDAQDDVLATVRMELGDGSTKMEAVFADGRLDVAVPSAAASCVDILVDTQGAASATTMKERILVLTQPSPTVPGKLKCYGSLAVAAAACFSGPLACGGASLLAICECASPATLAKLGLEC
jgi:hypothetical protein